MTDMRTAVLMHGANGAHSVFTLSVSRYALSPSSSGAESRLSLLEGDCVGLHGHYLKPGSQEPGFFCRHSGMRLPGQARNDGGSQFRASQSSFTRVSRSALAITLTEDSAIAAAPIVGESRMPN